MAVNPATSEALAPAFAKASNNEIHRAVAKAEFAFDEYRVLPDTARAAFLEAIADEILALGEALIQRCMLETALPEARLIGERGRTMNQLKLFASTLRDGSWVDARIDTAMPERQPLPRPDIRQMQIPLGPVAVFGASNFPLAFSVAGGDTVSALAAGCPVVFKGHPLHPGTSELVAGAIIHAAQKTGMPDGVFSLVHGQSISVGQALVAHPAICAVGFTGSFRGGKALFDAANQRAVPIPVYAEMGSTNPVFILPGALRERCDAIAAGLVGSLTMGVGQFCTNPGLVILPETADADPFLAKMNQALSKIPAGVMLGEGIKSAYQSGISQLIQAGAQPLSQGESDETGKKAVARVMTATADQLLENPALAHEVFGPSSVVVKSPDAATMHQIASQLDGHLTATIHGTEEDLRTFQPLIRLLERKVGRILINGFPTGVEVCHAMVHGGPYPATTAPQTTSVGTAAIRRFTRPVCYQDFPQELLPDALKDTNPLHIWRLVNGEMKKGA